MHNGNNANLIEIRPGVFVNKHDPKIHFKRMQMGVPQNELDEARSYIEWGKPNKAKEIYKRMLIYRDHEGLHHLLIPLLTISEALEMAKRYEHRPEIRDLYYQRVLELNPNHFLANRRMTRGLWWKVPLLIVASLLALTAFGLLLLKWYLYFNENKIIATRVNQMTTNQVTYIDGLPSGMGTNTITAGGGVSPSIPAIVHAVDGGDTSIDEPFVVQNEEGIPLGYALYEGNGQYHIFLLRGVNNGSSVPNAATTNSGVPINQNVPVVENKMAINNLRTAYAYYLQTHNSVPPRSLSVLQPDVPPGTLQTPVSFHPNQENVALAIMPLYGANIPYNQPEVLVGLGAHDVVVLENGHVFLQSKVGVGSPSQPTPTGSFTITGRIPEPSTSVYGPFVFPLNDSAFALHGTNQPSRIGQNDSIGCVEMPDPIDRELENVLPVGTPVIIQNQFPDTHITNPSSFR